MPLFRRSREAGPPEPEPPLPKPAPLPSGTRACTAGECSRHDGLPCAYVDRRGRQCPTAWCAEHRVAVAGKPYCRRHAGVVRALPPDLAIGLPDLENRAPSLLDWVARDLDAPIRALLQSVARPGDLITAEPTAQAFSGSTRARRWERSWKLADHQGIRRWVSLEVEEERPDEVEARVGGVLVLRLVPPWIEARHAGLVRSAADDAASRGAFVDALVGAVRAEVVGAGGG